MAVDMFLRLDEIPGEAADGSHQDEIDILAWSWGASQSGTTHMGGGGGSGKVSVQDISVTKYIDSASHLLLKTCANGAHIPTGTLTVRKAGENPLEYIVLDLQDIIVSSISTGGSGGEDRLTENISLNFASFDFKYVPQEQDGSGGADKEFGFDIAKNVVK